MDPHEIRREIDAILNKHNDAIRALQVAREAIHANDRGLGDAIAATRQLLEGVARANDALSGIYAAHGRAIDAAMEANQAALALLRQINGTNQS